MKLHIYHETLADAWEELKAIQYVMSVSRCWMDNPIACQRLDDREADLAWMCVKLESLCAMHTRQAQA